ncbi:type II secretion system minor pseudopilin GspI [Thiomicrorhabdus sp.]|jgi:general secretion pathway protein I|uniref:type II secretion system minor pseudopilin GspI n=1 Tax=Thiomicrorhabdus sp. TaxID=2039724 RepID=UPI0035692116
MIGSVRKRQQGFTLIEVMVALAVVSIALAALSRAMGLTVSNHSALDERIVATWVAEDELVKLQVMPNSRAEAKQEVTMLNRTWVSELATEDTMIADVKKATMTVTLEGSKKPSAALATVVGP